MQRRVDWIQLGILLLALFGLALHQEERLARIEQALQDANTERAEVLLRLERIENKLLK